MNNNGIVINGGNVIAGSISVNNTQINNDLAQELNKLYDALNNDKNIIPEIVEDVKNQLNKAASEQNKYKFLTVLKELGEFAGASSSLLTHVAHIKELVLRLF